jgi:hypothetical protein
MIAALTRETRDPGHGQRAPAHQQQQQQIQPKDDAEKE